MSIFESVKGEAVVFSRGAVGFAVDSGAFCNIGKISFVDGEGIGIGNIIVVGQTSRDGIFACCIQTEFAGIRIYIVENIRGVVDRQIIPADIVELRLIPGFKTAGCGIVVVGSIVGITVNPAAVDVDGQAGWSNSIFVVSFNRADVIVAFLETGGA